MEWSNQLIMDFLDLYEFEDLIWNPKNPDHKNKFRVADAWENIRKGLSQEISIAELKKKKEGLMATYRSLYQKVQQSKRSGAGSDDIYKPSWFCYNRMHRFLQDIYKPRQIVETENVSQYFQNFEIGSGVSDGTPFVVYEDSNTGLSQSEDDITGDTLVPVTGRKRLKSHHKPRDSCIGQMLEKQVDEACTVLKTVTQQSMKKQDECDIFGELVGKKLKKLDDMTRDIVMIDIQTLLARANRGPPHYHFPAVQPIQSKNHVSFSASCGQHSESSSNERNDLSDGLK